MTDDEIEQLNLSDLKDMKTLFDEMVKRGEMYISGSRNGEDVYFLTEKEKSEEENED